MAGSPTHPGSEEPSRSGSRTAGDPTTSWRWLTVAGCVLVAAGFGMWVAFASEQADAQNAGEAVSTGIKAGVTAGGLLLLGGFVALLVDGVGRGGREGRLVFRIARAIGLALLSVVVGFVVMWIVVHAAFA